MKPAPAVEVSSWIEVIEQPFVIMDRHYRIIAANTAYCRRYGVRPDSVIGRKCHEVSHHSPTPCHEHGEECPHRHVFEAGESSQAFHTHYDPSNRPEHVRIHGHVLRTTAGEVLLGEAIFHLADEAELDCDTQRMLGSSPAFLHCLDKLTRAAISDAPVLLVGDSGVGKELAARYVHQRSGRKDKPYVAINCPCMPETIFESELFGHERGAFTGSVGMKRGLFETADGGTLFLDEVAEIPLGVQAKLLRALESGEFRRVGGTQTLRADVRIVSATHRDLLHEVEQGRFRQDLYFRIAGIDIPLPPLRERRTDIPMIAETFLGRMSATSGLAYRLTENALARLTRYDYPGNVRELKNVLLKAATLSVNGLIRAEHIRFAEARSLDTSTLALRRGTLPDSTSLAEVERDHISRLIEQFDGHRRSVAQALGITERTLYRKIRRYGLGRPEMRPPAPHQGARPRR